MQRFLNIRNTCVRTFPSTPQVPISRLFNSRRPTSTFLNISRWSDSVIVSLEKRKFHTSVWSSAEIKEGDTSKLEVSNAPHQSSKINESSSVDDVVRWAEQFVGRDHASKLKNQEINGKALLELTEDDLKEMTIPIGPKRSLLIELKKLKEPQTQDPLKVLLDLKLPGLRNDFPLPRNTLTLAHFYFGHAHGREEALKQVLELMYKRWKVYTKRDKQPKTDAERRQHNRLMATLCCPGGGKTFFLDCLSHLKDVLPKDDVIKLFEDVVSKENIVEFKEWFKKLIFLPVSFNGETGLRADMNSWQFEFAVRLLYGYLATESNRNEFPKFRNELEKIYDKLEKKNKVLQIVQETMYKNEIASGNNDPCFMILLDEISKLKEESDRILLCSEVGGILDNSNYGQYDALITSLDITSLRKSTTTGSKRALMWIPIKAPGFEIALKLFPIGEKDLYSSKPFLILLYLSSFHWRTLETIKREEGELEKKKNDFSDMANWISKTIVGSPQLGLEDEPIICATFSADYLTSEAKIKDKTFEECIYHGYYANTYSNEPTVPIMSTLLIERWAKNPSCLRNHLAFLLEQIFELDKYKSNCYTFESFHGVWEAIRRYVLVKIRGKNFTCIMKISELYNNLGQKNFIDRPVTVEEVMFPCYDYDNIKPVINIVYDKEKGSLIDSSPLNKVYILGGWNPGFDIVTFHKDPKSQQIIPITINTKLSLANDKIQEIAEIKRNHKLTLEQFPESERKNVYFVAVCWRQPRKYESIPENTIILTRDHLNVLYSSLKQRPQLHFDIPEVQKILEDIK